MSLIAKELCLCDDYKLTIKDMLMIATETAMAQSPIPTYTTPEGVTFDGVFRFNVGGKIYFLTQNMDPSVSVDDEDLTETYDLSDGTRLHYRNMNAFRSRFAAAIHAGIKNIWVRPGSRVLYIGNDTSMVTISHISDIVGSAGMVYVVGPAQIQRNSLLGELGSKRSNVTCIDGVASSPSGYKETIGNIDVIFYEVDLELKDLALNAQAFLANGGYFCTFIKADPMQTDPPTPPVYVFNAKERELMGYQFKIVHKITISPADENCKCFVGSYGAV